MGLNENIHFFIYNWDFTLPLVELTEGMALVLETKDPKASVLLGTTNHHKPCDRSHYFGESMRFCCITFSPSMSPWFLFVSRRKQTLVWLISFLKKETWSNYHNWGIHHVFGETQIKWITNQDLENKHIMLVLCYFWQSPTVIIGKRGNNIQQYWFERGDDPAAILHNYRTKKHHMFWGEHPMK